MSNTKLDDDKLNLEIRKFLKRVGITAQREMERAIYDAVDGGELDTSGAARAKVTIELPDLDKTVVVEADLQLS